MIGLKSFSGFLGDVLGVSATALYERQRALVRAGVLPEAERGRGKGLLATPETVALLILAVLVTDSLSETDERVATLAHSQIDEDGDLCQLTKKSSLVDAVSEIFRNPKLAKRVALIRVNRTHLVASISWNRSGSEKLSLFGNYLEILMAEPQLMVEATVFGPALTKIASLLEADRYIESREAQRKGKA